MPNDGHRGRTPQDDIGHVTLNLSGEEAKQLLADMDHIVKISGDVPDDGPRKSIYGKLNEAVGRAMERKRQGRRDDE